MDWFKRHWHTVRTVVLTAVIVALSLIVIILVWDIGEDLEIDSVSDGVYFFGFLFLAGSLIAVIGIAVVSLIKLLRAKAVETPPVGVNNVSVDLAAIIKEIAAAPLWVAMAFIGIFLLVVGAFIDGYRYTDGGFTQATAVPAQAQPTATIDVDAAAPSPTPTPE